MSSSTDENEKDNDDEGDIENGFEEIDPEDEEFVDESLGLDEAALGLLRQRDPLARILFMADGRVLPQAAPLLEQSRRERFFVNHSGIKESCVPRREMLPKHHLEAPPPSSGHAKTTATCSCQRANGDTFDVRISNIRPNGFIIGELVLVDPKSESIPKSLRMDAGVTGYRVVSLTKTALSVHRLVSNAKLMYHESAPRKCFKRFLGSEKELVEQTLAGMSGEVFVDSFCDYCYGEKEFSTPQTLTVTATRVPQLARSKSAKEKVRKPRVVKPKNATKATKEENKQDEATSTRGRRKSKYLAVGTPKITTYFHLRSVAAAVP
jgi:hypothetical protein